MMSKDGNYPFAAMATDGSKRWFVRTGPGQSEVARDPDVGTPWITRDGNLAKAVARLMSVDLGPRFAKVDLLNALELIDKVLIR